MADHKCYRCHKNVYPVDKIGPLKDQSFFHKHCFKCYVCGIHLTLKTYFNNNLMQEDKEVYCTNHVPKATAGSFDGQAVGIKAALNVPKVSSVNEQIRGAGEKGTFDAHALGIRTTLSPPKAEDRRDSNSSNFKVTGRFDAGALHIAHAIHAQELQKGYPKQTYNAPLYYLDLDTQTELEMKHRTEEDDLYRRFQRHREQEEKTIYQEIQNEWDRALDTLTEKFNHELQIKKKKITVEDQKTLTLKLQREKEELEKVMTLKRDKKKESLTKKLLERERTETAELVDRHSREMLTLINQKKIEYSEGLNDDNKDMTPYPVNPPLPTPPPYSKAQIYSDPLVFKELDQIAINVAQEDQKTFTDLVRMLIHNCRSDVEKARAIFRWITVKDLNRMEFDDSVKADTPMGLLRGIKYGTESYHVLFKRLCSYAGLHCIVIKGYSKSAGYQPGIKFEDNRFRNSWNAVYVENSWRFVQCNWGARHLVNAKETPKPGARNKSDSLRYEYDDHYFLTDPEEFIYEFFPLPKEWQLLRKPIILEEFEDLPFVRSLFFRYGLWFPDASSRAIVHTDNTGAATVRINMPAEMAVQLIFHYNLKFYDDDLDVYDNISLKRFVLQSVAGNSVIFRVHAPCSGTFLLDIFANAVTPREYLTGEPMKFKSVCKFKIACKSLQTVMVPLPDCASGEWGPMKGSRLFGLIPITHEEALIFASRELEIQFRTTRPLSEFMASLHKNNIEEKRLSKYIKHSLSGEIVSFFITFPEDGQYGIDIYTRESLNHEVERAGDKHLLTHCCKYLINVTRK